MRASIDHTKLVGNEKSTGRFLSGKSVPRSRPTIFWEPQALDLGFNYQKYAEQRAERHQIHVKKMAHLEERRAKAEVEVQQLEDLLKAKLDETEVLTEKRKIEAVLEKKVVESFKKKKKKREEEKKIEMEAK